MWMDSAGMICLPGDTMYDDGLDLCSGGEGLRVRFGPSDRVRIAWKTDFWYYHKEYSNLKKEDIFNIHTSIMFSCFTSIFNTEYSVLCSVTSNSEGKNEKWGVSLICLVMTSHHCSYVKWETKHFSNLKATKMHVVVLNMSVSSRFYNKSRHPIEHLPNVTLLPNY